MIRLLSKIAMRAYVAAFGWEMAALHLFHLVRAIPGEDGKP